MNIVTFEWFEWLSSIQLQELEGLLPKEKDFNRVEKSFLCYNNKYRHWRADLYTIFYKHDLLKHSYFSMSDESGFIYESWADFWYSKKFIPPFWSSKISEFIHDFSENENTLDDLYLMKQLQLINPIPNYDFKKSILETYYM